MVLFKITHPIDTTLIILEKIKSSFKKNQMYDLQ